MPNYIRAKFEGGFYFFTVVTYHRYLREGLYSESNDFADVIKIGIEAFGE